MNATEFLSHRAVRFAVALALGLALAIGGYQWLTDPRPRQERQLQERVVLAARSQLLAALGAGQSTQVVDPVNTDRKVGKVYIYPGDDGWQVSGYYQWPGETAWYPWLMTLDGELELLSLKVPGADARAARAAATDPRINATP